MQPITTAILHTKMLVIVMTIKNIYNNDNINDDDHDDYLFTCIEQLQNTHLNRVYRSYLAKSLALFCTIESISYQNLPSNTLNHMGFPEERRRKNSIFKLNVIQSNQNSNQSFQ